MDIVPRFLRRIHADVPGESSIAKCDVVLREVSELQATPGQLSLLRVLVEHERCTMQALADCLAVAPSTVTAMVKRLLAQGYVERSRDDVDWRTVWVRPTERGRQVFAVFNAVRIASLQRRLAHLSPEERDCLASALPVLNHLLDVVNPDL